MANTTTCEDTALYAKLNATGEWFAKHAEQGSFVGVDGVDIHYARILQPDVTAPSLVVLTGWSESYVKYAELFHDLYTSSGMSIYTMDHRDQGMSGREMDDNPQKTHVRDFHHHVIDAMTFVSNQIHPESSNIALFGFSLGGLVASRMVLAFPEYFERLVLVAPALVPLLPPSLSPLVAELVGDALCGLGQCAEYVPGHSDSPDHKLLVPPFNRVSDSVPRLKNWEVLREKLPQTNVNGMSVSHLREMLRARVNTPELMHRFELPVLLLSSGKDVYVDNSAHELMAREAPNCKRVVFPTSKHEIHFELDEHREGAVREITEFLNDRQEAYSIPAQTMNRLRDLGKTPLSLSYDTDLYPSITEKQQLFYYAVVAIVALVAGLIVRRVWRHNVRQSKFVKRVVGTSSSATTQEPAELTEPTEGVLSSSAVAKLAAKNRAIQDKVATEKLQRADEFYDKHAVRGSFRGDNDVMIEYVKLEQPSKTAPAVCILTGWSEAFLKYKEFMHELYEERHVSVYAMDHRSQGLSGRETDTPQCSYVEDFNHHVNDAANFIKWVVPGEAEHVTLFGFSLGGLVTVHTVLQNPRLVDSVILVAPCLSPLTPLPQRILLPVADFMCWLGYGKSYVFGQGDAPDHKLLMPPENRVSTCPNRLRMFESIRKQFEETIVSGVSFSHFREMLRFRVESDEIVAQYNQLDKPTLLITAGIDVYVSNDHHDFFAANVDNVERVVIPHARHEILFERCEIRKIGLDAIMRFLKEKHK